MTEPIALKKDCAYCRNSEFDMKKREFVCKLALPGPAKFCTQWSDARKPRVG
jgi:hypothetical protein